MEGLDASRACPLHSLRNSKLRLRGLHKQSGSVSHKNFSSEKLEEEPKSQSLRARTESKKGSARGQEALAMVFSSQMRNY